MLKVLMSLFRLDHMWIFLLRYVLILELYVQYAELKPVPCITYADAFALREQCATPILKQVIFIYAIMILNQYTAQASNP